MKIVCDSCATKYSIADEKVRGKVFKIRCKKCSHIIVVKGTELADEIPTTVASGAALPGMGEPAGGTDAAPTDAVWHLVINREQVGPMAPDEVRARFSRGEVDGDTYAWREGFGDWQRLAAISDFADLGSGANGHGEPTQRADGDPFGRVAGASGGGDDDLFGAGQPAMAAAPASGGGTARPIRSGIFASAEPPPGLAGGGGFAAAQPAEPAQPAMTGQRNENSVLFSLNNLQALTMGSNSAPAPSSSNGGAKAGYADRATEGSGLIDIRAMAATHLAKPSASAAATSGDPLDDVPLFSPMAAAAPLLVPVAAPPQQNKTLLYALIGIAAMLFLGIIVVLVVILHTKTPPVIAQGTAPTPSTANPAAPIEPAHGAAPANVGSSAAPAVSPSGNAGRAVLAGNENAAPSHVREVAPSRPARSGEAVRPSNAAPPPAPAQPPPVPTPPPPHGGGGDDLDALLGGAGGGGGGGRAHEAAPAPSAPALTQGDVIAGFNGVAGDVHACFSQYHVPGMALVSVHITSSGGASGVSVGGAIAGSAEASCVASAVRGAHWRASPGLSVRNYPFNLH